MTISRVELQGQVTRAQDFTNIKQNEDHKGMIDQSNFQSQTQQKVENRMHQVNKSDQAENRQKKFDAKEQGNGTYAGDGGQHRKQHNEEKDGKVFVKGQGSFDIRV